MRGQDGNLLHGAPFNDGISYGNNGFGTGDVVGVHLKAGSLTFYLNGVKVDPDPGAEVAELEGDFVFGASGQYGWSATLVVDPELQEYRPQGAGALVSEAPSTEGNDMIIAYSLDDTIDGFGGDDLLKGQDGNDTLSGGAGSDELQGGAGADTFVFKTLGENALGEFDTIVDFDATDTLSFSSEAIYGFAGLTGLEGNLADLITANEAVDFLNGLNETKDAKATFIFEAADPQTGEHSALYYDADGSGTSYESTKIAEFDNDATITAADIEIITG